jgi:tetratricopeptide (TPR) repeat protein
LEDLLPRWAEEIRAGTAGNAERLLARAANRAAYYESAHSDDLVRRVVDETARSPTGAAAVLAYRRARRAYAQRRLSECVQQTRLAVSAPATALAVPAFLTASSCHHLAGDATASLTALDASEKALQTLEGSFPIWEGQIAWMRALSNHAAGNLAAGIDGYDEALERFQAAEDPARQTSIYARRADVLQALGRGSESWRDATLGLRLRDLPLDGRYFALTIVEDLAFEEGFSSLSASIASNLVEHAEDDGDPAHRVDASWRLGRSHAGHGRTREAVAAFRYAIEVTEHHPEQVRRPLPFLAVALAESLARTDPDETTRVLEEFDVFARSTGDLYLRAALARAEADRRLGNPTATENALREAITRAERERAGVGDLPEQDDLLAARQAAYESLVELLVDRGRSDEALAWVLRSRSLAGPGPGGDGPFVTGAETGVVYLALPDRLLVWRARGREATLIEKPVGLDALRLVVSEASSTPISETSWREIGRLLLEGVVAAGDRNLLFSPGETLGAVPFALLPDPNTSDPLAAAHVVSVSPSLRSADAEALTVAGGCALVVLGATHGGKLFPDLQTLRNLEIEAGSVARLYLCATMARSFEELTDALRGEPPVALHYVGHSTRLGTESVLVMASAEGVRPVRVADLPTEGLHGTRVVLSSCSAADGKPSLIAGRSGLATDLLRAGATAVIANLWPVDDDEAPRFAEVLHHRLSRGGNPSESLGLVQKAFFRESADPSIWGGWLSIH